jgi:hypothetical protein
VHLLSAVGLKNIIESQCTTTINYIQPADLHIMSLRFEMLFSGDLLGNKLLAWDQLLILINIIPAILFVLMLYLFEFGIYEFEWLWRY